MYKKCTCVLFSTILYIKEFSLTYKIFLKYCFTYLLADVNIIIESMIFYTIGLKKKGKVYTMTKFKEAQIKAEVLEEIYNQIEGLRKNFVDWYMDDWKEKIKDFDAQKLEDDTLEEDWTVRNARMNYEEGEYKLEIYDAVLEKIEKML